MNYSDLIMKVRGTLTEKDFILATSLTNKKERCVFEKEFKFTLPTMTELTDISKYLQININDFFIKKQQENPHL